MKPRPKKPLPNPRLRSPKPLTVEGMIVDRGDGKKLDFDNAQKRIDEFVAGLNLDRLVKVTFEAVEE